MSYMTQTGYTLVKKKSSIIKKFAWQNQMVVNSSPAVGKIFFIL